MCVQGSYTRVWPRDLGEILSTVILVSVTPVFATFRTSTPVVVDASNVSTVTIIQHGCQGLGAPRQCRRCLERGGKVLPSGGLWTRELMPPPKIDIDMALLHSVSTGLIPFAA